LSFTAFAQDDVSAWEVTLLHADSGHYQLLTVTAEGIHQQTPLPDGFALGQAGARLSPDGRYLVTNQDNAPFLLVADLDAGTCCKEIPFNDTVMDVVTLGGFNPEGTQIAVSYLLDEPAMDLFVTRLMAIDVTTGETVAQFETTPDTLEGGVLPYQQLLEWREDGVTFYESCIMCVEETSNQVLQVWNPDTNDIRYTEEAWDGAGDTLPLTGERLQAVNSGIYPIPDNQDIRTYTRIANVVTLSGRRAPEGSAVVYYDFANSDLLTVRWVADGNAFLVFPYASATGSATTLVVPGASPQPQLFWIQDYLAATPGGWLVREQESLVHFIVGEDSSVTQQALGDFPGGLSVVRATPLGTTADAEFLSVLPPQSITCPGFVASQLTVGGEGVVTPGAANNVRAFPTTNSQIVAKIAAGERFEVLAGPVCNNGLAWWRVQYLNFVGWTAEGQGEVYWVLPLD